MRSSSGGNEHLLEKGGIELPDAHQAGENVLDLLEEVGASSGDLVTTRVDEIAIGGKLERTGEQLRGHRVGRVELALEEHLAPHAQALADELLTVDGGAR